MAVCVFFGHRNTPEDIKGRFYTESFKTYECVKNAKNSHCDND